MRDWGFPIGVHHLHEDTSLDFQLNRLATLGGGRLEEIRTVAPRIRDLADWKREFLALADRCPGQILGTSRRPSASLVDGPMGLRGTTRRVGAHGEPSGPDDPS